jgi:hypothetical protein
MLSQQEFDIKRYDAVEQSDGSYMDNTGNIMWYNEYGDYHRDDGPAVIESNGDAYWRIHGETLSFAEWCKKTRKSDEAKMMLRLRYE